MPANADETATNREYKDSVFTLLFGEKENLLELYNAIENTSYGSDTDIKITTLRNALYKGQINDISFVINGKVVVLVEHQSTINENIPLRMLTYMSKVYGKTVPRRKIYQETQITIPRPEFIVLYNGNKKYPDSKVLKLSDMFAGSCAGDTPDLELVVRVFNINKGHNKKFAERSKLLKGYETFVYLAKKHAQTMSRDAAIDLAIDECIRQKVLKDFLEEHSSEVRNMLFHKWNWDEALDVRYEEGEAKGVAIGEARGVKKGMKKGIAIGRDETLLQTARNMKAKGLNIALIAEITGLSEKDIEGLDI